MALILVFEVKNAVLERSKQTAANGARYERFFHLPVDSLQSSHLLPLLDQLLLRWESTLLIE